MGDAADGYPGLRGWGAKSAAAVLMKFGHFEQIPADPKQWQVAVSNPAALSQTLRAEWDRALLFRDLATLRTDFPLFESIDDLRWAGPTLAFEGLGKRLDAARVVKGSKRLPPRRPTAAV